MHPKPSHSVSLMGGWDNDVKMKYFFSPPVLMHGGLLCIAFRLSVRLSICLWLENNSLDQKSLDKN